MDQCWVVGVSGGSVERSDLMPDREASSHLGSPLSRAEPDAVVVESGADMPLNADRFRIDVKRFIARSLCRAGICRRRPARRVVSFLFSRGIRSQGQLSTPPTLLHFGQVILGACGCPVADGRTTRYSGPSSATASSNKTESRCPAEHQRAAKSRVEVAFGAVRAHRPRPPHAPAGERVVSEVLVTPTGPG
jgi:hypothetical protein